MRLGNTYGMVSTAIEMHGLNGETSQLGGLG
jgi:hypothetical protein